MVKLNSNRCPLCLGNTAIYIDLNHLLIRSCNRCGLKFVPEIRYIENSGDYFSNFELRTYKNYYEPFRKRIFKENWEKILLWKKRGRSLDIGASFGWFLQVAPKNWITEGMELSKATSLDARKRGLHIVYGDEKTLEKSGQKYDLITLWNVIEHLHKPREVLRSIHKHLAPSGIVALSFPNRAGLSNAFAYFLYFLSFGKVRSPLYVLFQVGNSSPHIFHFSQKDIVKLLIESGFEILETGKQPIIDIGNLDTRMKLEKNQKMGLLFLQKLSLIFLYYFSIVLNLPDEIVIYARKL